MEMSLFEHEGAKECFTLIVKILLLYFTKSKICEQYYDIGAPWSGQPQALPHLKGWITLWAKAKH